MGNPALVRELRARLALPAVAGPMFLVSSVKLTLACCRAGIIGSLPALNARSSDIFEIWMAQMAPQAGELGMAPYAINIIVHHSNPRLEADLSIAARYEAPIIIASVGNPAPVVERVKGYGGLVFSDVASVRHARRAAESGADALILLCAGAGGQTGWLNPLAFVSEVREFFVGPLIVAGGLTRGRHLRAIEQIGADFGLLGTSFIAATESFASDAYRDMLIESGADDIATTSEVTGIPANMLRPSLERAGFKPSKEVKEGPFSVVSETETLRAWRDVWSAGHGVGDVRAAEPAAAIVTRLREEYAAAAGPAKVCQGLVPAEDEMTP